MEFANTAPYFCNPQLLMLAVRCFKDKSTQNLLYLRMPRKRDLADFIAERITSNRRSCAFVRADFEDLGGYNQVGRALKELVARGKLVRVGYGIYGKARASLITGEPVPVQPLNAIAAQGLRKLGYRVEQCEAVRAYNEGRTTQIPMRQPLNVGDQRISRTIEFEADRVLYERTKPRRRRAS